MRYNQIDEIAKLICTYPQCIHHNIIGECANAECQTVYIAENLFDKGYRKASDVAREIFEEIDRMCIDTFGNFNHRVFAELKKKYESEGEE